MEIATRLYTAAQETNQRRVLVLAGGASRTRERAGTALDVAGIDPGDACYIGSAGSVPARQLSRDDTDGLLGTTQQAVVVDCHDRCEPNVLGRAVGAVDGGGLLILLTPPLADWPTVRDAFDESLAVPPSDVDAVGDHFRTRLVKTLRQHRGIAIVDVDTDTVKRDGHIDTPPSLPESEPVAPDDYEFPAAAYDACRTQDQADAVATLEALRSDGQAVVVEADRGRGKSSAAGLAAAALALDGADVLVTAPQYQNAAEIFGRAVSVLDDCGELVGQDDSNNPQHLQTETGQIRFASPTAASRLPDDPDCLLIDEAAALPVRLLEQFLAADRVAFATTIHGYEGAGRGFSVRFRDHLAESDHDVTEVSLATPIRFAPADPVEVWSFRALGLDARPCVPQVIDAATPETTDYRPLSAATLRSNDRLLREAFGLLVMAHYRTEPNDLARLLDAPNVSVRALCHDGHVVSVALLAQEGNLPESLRRRMYEGGRVRGNMLPDVLTSQLRDEAAAVPVGWRVLRIATHHAVRSRGLGSALLDAVRDEARGELDWVGVGYGATPELLDFWRENGFSTVHLSTTRNDSSGEHSAVMLDPLSSDGEALAERHTRWFRKRLPAVLGDSLATVDPDIVRGTLASISGTVSLELSAWEWRVAAGLTSGMAIFDTAPRPVVHLAFRHLVDPAETDILDDRQERLLVVRVLQRRTWAVTATELGFPSSTVCKRALAAAVEPLVRCYGGETARAELERAE